MNDLKKLFGKRVKIFRQKQKLSQEELAEKIGIAVTNMGKIERGESFVTAATLAKLAQVLDIEVKELFDFENYKPVEDMKREINLEIQSDENIKLIYKIYKLFVNE